MANTIIKYGQMVHEREFDAYYKKTVPLSFGGHEMTFAVSQSLFSSSAVDTGTQRLLRTIAPENLNGKKILDLGCGYGPIGIALKKTSPACDLHMVDRDALAIEFSRKNCEVNNVWGANIYPSLGYDDVAETDFDLIVSNIPAKVGEPVLAYLLTEAGLLLRASGTVAIVVIDAIADYVEGVLANPIFKIVLKKSWPGHVVYHYQFAQNGSSIEMPKETAFDRGVYNRDEMVIYGLPEFDSLSYETEMLIDGTKIVKDRKFNEVLIFNLKQGHVARRLVKTAEVGKLFLVDRDLLALRVTRRNLTNDGFSNDNLIPLHQIGIGLPSSPLVDAVLGVLDDKDSPAVHASLLSQAAAMLRPNGILLLASGSTEITRLEKMIQVENKLEILERKRVKGKSMICLKRR
jgi:16S rRNA G1207 methylase RsmC